MGSGLVSGVALDLGHPESTPPRKAGTTKKAEQGVRRNPHQSPVWLRFPAPAVIYRLAWSWGVSGGDCVHIDVSPKNLNFALQFFDMLIAVEVAPVVPSAHRSFL